MNRYFNIAGICVPNKHYMVDISDKVRQIMSMVERGDYFTINRGRQYGKTTIIRNLEQALPISNYICASISFQDAFDDMFGSESGFCQRLLDKIHRDINLHNPEEAKNWIDPSVTEFNLLDKFLTKICKDKKIVLIVDEIDRTSDNHIFLQFIAMLREKYLAYNKEKDYTFHSVILAGVTDIRNIKMKIVQRGLANIREGESKYNSPWNIAVPFEVQMYFCANDISSMLKEYENDHKTGMDISAISNEIYNYTSGYPFLVSRICQIIDTEYNKIWNIETVQKAVKKVEYSDNLLFDDMAKNLEIDNELFNLLYDISVGGKTYIYNPLDPVIKTAKMYNYIRETKNGILIDNRIFEVALCEYFITKELRSNKDRPLTTTQNEIVQDNLFNMELCLKKFLEHVQEIYNDKDMKFWEKHGRLIFLTFLRPLINGAGFYYLESETNVGGKIDVVVNYEKQQFILELKLWYGDVAHKKAYEQLANYLSGKKSECGYLLTFDFRKKTDDVYAEPKWVEFEDKKIYDCVVRVGG